MNKTVCFTGHRPDKLGGYDENNPIADHVKNMLYVEIIYAIQNGYTNFIHGGAIGVDMWAGEAVLDLKNIFPHITLALYRPFIGQERRWNKETQDRYNRLADAGDTIRTVCEGDYSPWKMQVRNIAMVDNSDLVIAVWNGTKGGTGNCVAYVTKKGKQIIRINPTEV